MINLVVLYPPPTDAEKFEADYKEHLILLHEKTGIPSDARPYTITKFLPSPVGAPYFYQMFTMPFDSQEALNATMASPEMQEVAADAGRISTGGAPLILIGNQD